MKTVFTLKPAESKSLIAKAVVSMEEVKKAKESAYIILAGGTTNAYIARELLGGEGIDPSKCTVGTSSNGVVCVSSPGAREIFPNVIFKGKPSEKTITEAFEDFNAGTVVIKGANAVDREKNVGVITAGFDGGTVPKIIGPVTSNGLKLITPVGLEKLVPSVREACRAVGARRIDISMGADFGMYHIATSTVVTEIEAIELLFGLKAVHVASGGVGGNEGAVVLAADGDAESVERLVDFIENTIKGEPPVKPNKGICETCRYRRCRYCGRKTEELPEWLR